MHERLLIGLSLVTHNDPEVTGPMARSALKARHSTSRVWTPKPHVALQGPQPEVTQMAGVQVVLPAACPGDLRGPP